MAGDTQIIDTQDGTAGGDSDAGEFALENFDLDADFPDEDESADEGADANADTDADDDTGTETQEGDGADDDVGTGADDKGADADPDARFQKLLDERLAAETLKHEQALKAQQEAFDKKLAELNPQQRTPANQAEARAQYFANLKEGLKQAGLNVSDDALVESQHSAVRAHARAMFGGHEPEAIVGAIGQLVQEVQALKSGHQEITTSGAIKEGAAAISVKYGDKLTPDVRAEIRAVGQELKETGATIDPTNQKLQEYIVQTAIARAELKATQAQKAKVEAARAAKKQTTTKLDGAGSGRGSTKGSSDSMPEGAFSDDAITSILRGLNS